VLKPALRGDITLSQFEARFMRLWHETRQRGERNPKVVEDLFHYVKNYVADSSRITPGSADVDDKTLLAAVRRCHSKLAPKGALALMQSWFAAVLPLCIVLMGVAGAQEIPMPPAEPPAATAPAPNPILVLEGCVRTRAQQLEISREAADLVAIAAIQKCNRELTTATTAGGQPRSLAEARQQLKDAMREIAVTEIVDIRAARYQPPAAKEADPKPAPRRTVRRKAAAKPAAAKPAATPPQ
jgi:hypothetical protein